MKQLLSPKQVAASVGASESSLKRWCDQGLIPIERTPGGHRRIRLRDAVQFIRQRGGELVEPTQIGLPSDISPTSADLDVSIEPLAGFLDKGDAAGIRRIAFDCYLGGASLAKLCDQLLTPAMHHLGDEWQCGRLDIYQERRACELVNHLIYELGEVAPRPGKDAPAAIGGSPEGDHYRLATQMVALALAEIGWNSTSLGTSLPYTTMAQAAREHQPALFWLSLSQAEEQPSMADEIADFAGALPEATTLVLGGQAVTPAVASAINTDRVKICSNLLGLQELAKSLDT